VIPCLRAPCTYPVVAVEDDALPGGAPLRRVTCLAGHSVWLNVLGTLSRRAETERPLPHGLVRGACQICRVTLQRPRRGRHDHGPRLCERPECKAELARRLLRRRRRRAAA
jgi:hypothetical protein